MGAYSMQIEQARRFALLAGNYSREKFNHPGPAFLYAQAWGEDLDAVRVRARAPGFSRGGRFGGGRADPGLVDRGPVRMVSHPRAAHRATALAVALALAGCAAFAAAPLTRLSAAHADPRDPAATGPIADPSLPAGVARIGALAGGRYAVISFPHDAWPEFTGVLVQAERTAVPACVADLRWVFMLTSQFICAHKEILDGRRFRVWLPGTVPPGVPVLFRLRRGVVASGTS